MSSKKPVTAAAWHEVFSFNSALNSLWPCLGAEASLKTQTPPASSFCRFLGSDGAGSCGKSHALACRDLQPAHANTQRRQLPACPTAVGATDTWLVLTGWEAPLFYSSHDCAGMFSVQPPKLPIPYRKYMDWWKDGHCPAESAAVVPPSLVVSEWENANV